MPGTVGILLMDKADDAGFVLVDLVLLIYDAVAERGEAAEAQTLLSVLAHPATDVLGKLAGVFLRHGLQDRLQQHALAAVADALGDGQNAHAIRAQFFLVDCAVVPVAGKAIKLPHEHKIKRALRAVRDQPLEFRPRFGVSTGQRPVAVFADNAVSALLRVFAAFGKLAVYGLIVLPGGRIPGVDHDVGKIQIIHKSLQRYRSG